MTNSDTGQKKLQGLQVLRGLAAVLVLWCHLKFSLGQDPDKYSGIPLLATNFGAIGVDIFFVISGFVITMTAVKLGDNWRAFMALRVARIVPLYFAISSYVLLEAMLSSHFVGKPLRFTHLQIFNTYVFIPIFDYNDFSGPILVNGWTLSFEMWFYLCFAGLLLLSAGRRTWIWFTGFFTVGTVVGLVFFQDLRWYLPKFLVHPMTLEFCAGCILYQTRTCLGKYGVYVLGGLSPLFLYLAWNSPALGTHWTILNDPMAGLHRALVWGGFAVCLVGAIAQIDLNYSWSWPRFLLLIGDASYSIYLISAAFMMTFVIALQQLNKWVGHDLTPSPWPYGAIYVLGSIAAGILSWKFFELPTTRLAKQFLFRFVPDKRKNQNAPSKMAA